MKFMQIRHGSHIVGYKGKKYLVDPVLADKGTTFALPKGRVNGKNPLTPLPFGTSFLDEIDAVIVTHMHFDHFDKAAMKLISKSMPIYCHESVASKLNKKGFTNVKAVGEKVLINENCVLEAVNGGQHGIGIPRKLMGRTTGYIFKDLSKVNTEPVVFLVGDSIWCDAVKNAIDKNKPDIIIAFAGEARLPFGKPITMSTYDIEQLALIAKKSEIVVNHMDTWNHCYLTRKNLKEFIKDKSYAQRILIPDDGETIEFGDAQ